MSPLSVADYETAIAATHGAKSRYVGTEHVHEQHQGETVWEGDVLVFELLDHPTAKRCYAWVTGRRVTAVLGIAGIDSAVKAIRASILAEDDS
jgi:hypothetical protein